MGHQRARIIGGGGPVRKDRATRGWPKMAYSVTENSFAVPVFLCLRIFGLNFSIVVFRTAAAEGFDPNDRVAGSGL